MAESSTLPVTVRELRKWRTLVQKASKIVHSSGYLPNGEKVPILGPLAVVKREIDKKLQLELFSSSQLKG